MAVKKPLVIDEGVIKELQDGDTIPVDSIPNSEKAEVWTATIVLDDTQSSPEDVLTTKKFIVQEPIVSVGEETEIKIPQNVKSITGVLNISPQNGSDQIGFDVYIRLNGATLSRFFWDYDATWTEIALPFEAHNIPENSVLSLDTIIRHSGSTLYPSGKIYIHEIANTINIGLSELPPFKEEEVLTSERWIDGKPIYKKVIDFGNLPNNTTKSVVHNISNVDNIWIDVGNSYLFEPLSPSGKQTLQYSSNTEKDSVRYYSVNTTNVVVSSVQDMSSWNGVFTIKYTKTTDTANSPVALVGSQGDRLSLGEFASDPTTDNEGNALLIGATYRNTVENVLKIYDGSQWVTKVNPNHNHDDRYFTETEIEEYYYDKKYIDLLIRFRKNDPTESENPPTQEVLFVNVKSGEIFVCTDNTKDRNTWVGQLGTRVP